MLRRRRLSINRSLWWHICFVLYLIEKINNIVMIVCRLFVAVKVVIRIIFVLLNNVYCIPTYCVWMLMLLPLRKLYPPLYWKMEGLFFHWLLAMVTMWSWTAGYDREYLVLFYGCIFNDRDRFEGDRWWLCVEMMSYFGRILWWKIRLGIVTILSAVGVNFECLFVNDSFESFVNDLFG